MAINLQPKKVKEGTPKSAPQILGVGLIKEEQTKKVVGIGVVVDHLPTSAQGPAFVKKVKKTVNGWGAGKCACAANGWNVHGNN